MRSVIFGVAVLVAMMASVAEARDHLRILSSPGDFPFTAKVSERFARSYHRPKPVIQRSGQRTNVRRFCSGVGLAHPDIISLSRPLRNSEIELCRQNGVRRITEIKVGYEAVVLARQRGTFRFDVSKRDLFLALAKEVPMGGRIVRNPYRLWSDISSYLPPIPIRVIGPRADSEVRHAFLSLVMEPACREFTVVGALSAERRAQVCSTMRSDNAFQAVSRSYDDTVRVLMRDTAGIALMPYSIYEEWDEVLATVKIEGVEPNERTLGSNRYSVTCPLFVYVKTQHYDSVPGVLEFITEYTSDRAWGPDGYLIDDGLIPMSEMERRSQRANAIGLSPMNR